MPQVLLFNPWSARHGWRIPNSILQVGASIEGQWDYAFIDGNREKDPWVTIEKYLKAGDVLIFGCTVMPGPQLRQAIPITKKIKDLYPHVMTVWGGYFASNQYETCLQSGIIDYIIDGPGDYAFPQLMTALTTHGDISQVVNLVFKKGDQIIHNHRSPIPEMDSLPQLPFEKLDTFYSIQGYLGKSYLGTKTAAYHSSFGCPFTCSFCAVVPIYKARWKGKSAHLIYQDVKYLMEQHGADAVEFHDNNFFVSEKRTAEFSRLIKGKGLTWWGEGRIDTIDRYSDETLLLMREAGCKMIFFGAETSSSDLLKKMDKGGTQTPEQMKRFAARMRKSGIIPEYSFVLGFPAETQDKVMDQIDDDIAFIKEIKEINPETEIIIYVYSPVPTEGSDMYETVKKTGFTFPKNLNDWLNPVWQNFDLRKNPLTPWLTPAMIDKIRGFETVLNAQFPTITDFKVTSFQKKVMKAISQVRYQKNIFHFPYELKALQKFWLRYRQPEIEGVYME